MTADKLATFGVFVIRKAVNVGDNKVQKVPSFLKATRQKKFFDILQKQLLFSS